ncbi:peroxisomal nicotinamide adenine dinucleotide carrier isoform X4 [Arachis hypogaea]|uniref:peroxisomal nicotinamide adenine dinucleotide carrier isoform X4 n=1 Tax=Arachis hypogaea TaxID=3818 RepID=UPI003B22409B
MVAGKERKYYMLGGKGGVGKTSCATSLAQGVYYYFYQIFRNKAEVAALEQKRLGIGDGSVGMFSLLIVAIFSVCVNVLLTNPIWVVVMRMQTHRKESSRTLSGDVLLNATEQALVPAVEPLAYGTSDVVGNLSVLFQVSILQ